MADSANSKETRNRKAEEEMRKFNEKWTFEYFFIENTDPCVSFAIKLQDIMQGWAIISHEGPDLEKLLKPRAAR